MIKPRRVGHATFETTGYREADRLLDRGGRAGAGRAREEARVPRLQDRPAVDRSSSRPTATHCTRLSFEVAPDSDFDALAKELAKDGIKSELRNDSIPGMGKVLTFKDNKDTSIDLFTEWKYLGSHHQVERHRPAQARPHRLPLPGREGGRRLLRQGDGLQGLGLDRGLVRVHALQHRPSHRELHQGRQGTSCITSPSS